MKLRKLVLGILPVLLCVAANNAFAADQITATVNLTTSTPTPLVDYSGQTDGTTGVVHVWYTYTTSPCANTTSTVSFATLNMDLLDSANVLNGPGPSSYPITVTFSQSGAEPVRLGDTQTPTLGPGGSNSISIPVSIDCSKGGSATTFAGHMDVSSASGSHSISGIEVIIQQANTTSCLDFLVTNQDDGRLLPGAPDTPSVAVVTNKSGIVKTTNPGELSVDALVLKGCSSAAGSLLIGLAPGWQTNPLAPGNATFVVDSSTLIDTPNLVAYSQQNGTPSGVSLCIPVQFSSTDTPYAELLVTVHSQITSGETLTALKAMGPNNNNPFVFTAQLFSDNACSAAITNSPHATYPVSW